jgi:hypothetical protein
MRMEAVKLPHIYKDKEVKRRDSIENELLANFAKVINTRTDFHKLP